MAWETVIGLEIHAQLATRAKIFSAAATAFGAEPNRQASAIDLGMPGVLPVLNREVVRMAVQFGLAIEADIDQASIFARKNYFYADLPKGYQISQYARPIVGRGHIDIDLAEGQSKRIGVTRAHLEEDAGKSVHDLYPGMSAIDLNRAGTPLLEIVSEPEMRSSAEAVAYARAMHVLVRYLGICDGNMQEGSFRCDANVSVRPQGSDTFGTRVEIKNLNSFRFLQWAIEYEVERQIELIESGGRVVQETRLFDPEREETRPMRSKEDAEDYRYFPDPDLLPVQISHADIDSWRMAMPELPQQRRQRYIEQLGLSADDARILLQERATADYFDAMLSAGAEAKAAANWIIHELLARLERESMTLEDSPVDAAQLATLVKRISDNTLSGKLARQVFDALFKGEGDSVDAIIDERGLRQVNDSAALQAWVDQVIAEHPQQVAEYLAGKEKILGFLVGKAMKLSRGKANPAQINAALVEAIQKQA